MNFKTNIPTLIYILRMTDFVHHKFMNKKTQECENKKLRKFKKNSGVLTGSVSYGAENEPTQCHASHYTLPVATGKQPVYSSTEVQKTSRVRRLDYGKSLS
jgi:hypothetical protein